MSAVTSTITCSPLSDDTRSGTEQRAVAVSSGSARAGDRKAVLVCLPAAPFPARRNGDAIRYFPIIEHLSQPADVDVVQLVSPWAPPPPMVPDFVRRFSTIARQTHERSLLRRSLRRLRTLIFPVPPNHVFFDDRRLVQRKLEALLTGRHYDVCVWVSIRHFDTACSVLKGVCDRVVLDAVDSQYSAWKRTSDGSILDRLDLHWLRRWELRLACKADATIYASMSDIMELGSSRAICLPNGVYTDGYVDEEATIEGLDDSDTVIGFLGHMAYGPNIAAAERLRKVVDKARAYEPALKLLIIGRSPGSKIREMAGDPHIVVTGEVDNIWPYIHRADVFAFPMDYGAGQQNKLLEVMRCMSRYLSPPYSRRVPFSIDRSPR